MILELIKLELAIKQLAWNLQIAPLGFWLI